MANVKEFRFDPISHFVDLTPISFHCGSEIVSGDEYELAAELRTIARRAGIEAQIAHDRLELVLR